MKRATLTAYPTTHSSEPVDLTDRLLQREDGQPSAAPARRRRKQSVEGQIQPKATPVPVPPAASALEAALSATDSATQALRAAARAAPARYEVALHYRLDALAHHLQQVQEYVASLAAR